MTASVKGSVIVRRADGTNYASASARVYSASISENTDVTQVFEATLEAAPSSGTIVDATVDTIYGFVVRNESTSVDVTVTWDDSDASSNSQRLAPGKAMCIEDNVTSLTLVADSDADPGPYCYILVWGKSVAA